MDTFEQKIAETVKRKLNDGTVEKLVGEYIEKGVSDALNAIFSWQGAGRKLIEEKMNETIVPVIERHDFNRYLIKLDSVLTEIINETTLKDNKKILENFKTLMKEPEEREIQLSDIFRKYCSYVAEEVDTHSLEARCDDGDPYYGPVSAEMEVVREDKRWFQSDYDDCTVSFTCREDKKPNCQVELFKRKDEKNWMLKAGDPLCIHSLRYLSNFEVFLTALKRGFAEIFIDEESAREDDIEPEKTPEYTLS